MTLVERVFFISYIQRSAVTGKHMKSYKNAEACNTESLRAETQWLEFNADNCVHDQKKNSFSLNQTLLFFQSRHLLVRHRTDK